MTILQINTDFTGQAGMVPRRPKINTTSTYAQITTAGFLDGAIKQGFTFYPTDFIDISYSDGNGGTLLGTFQYANAAGISSLTPTGGDVALPVTANHMAVFVGTDGTIGDDAATAINGGNIQAGLSGTAGYLASFPATASKGSLRMTAVANTGNTLTTISNVAMGQASVVSIPDPAAATANFVVAPAALVSGNIVTASGTAGLIIDGGLASNRVLTSSFNTPDVNANMVYFSVSVAFSDLATGGSKVLFTSSGSKQYILYVLGLSDTGGDWATGNRLLLITDNTTNYSAAPATSLTATGNYMWGDTGLPLPASGGWTVPTAAGASLVAKYTGGTTDYTSGTITVAGLLIRVA